jgi:uncharacterized protein (TIGR03083 family)
VTADDRTAAFEAAADLLVAIVDQVHDSAWEQPGLGTWTVRELVAHACRGLTTAEDYLLHPVDPASVPADYGSADAIAERARVAVAALGNDPARTVREARDRVVAVIAAAPADATVGTPFGTFLLADYLSSRTAELALHSMDIADAIGASLDVPDAVVHETLISLITRAAQRGFGHEVLHALSGRAPLPDGFNVF